ncbi:PTS lactose transporter subunit IIB [Grimontia sp. AD028]|uniref:PTS lactose transporter subunit IIB n=4 Tax=Vibrionaceae TaxID=641 RepID=A0A135I4N2_9GAMM|nr:MULTISPECIES: PTS sugar transporter subunit IIB [Vibrionaceae]EOD80711.1 putative sugar phosphotransferase component II B [Grimontia indica]KKD60758.1 PTS lactose transporter subunit IIB [Grimontia sp. AD028]KXF80409.1 PTS lactose transporter subunit IIB [Enterovibrio coralii]MBV7299465.1 PTS sugar transporter subunit IIB [Enterovibrio paralichthyis]NGN97701.1 PTS sugar transporter subunit IIB [Grimontia sedimenti]
MRIMAVCSTGLGSSFMIEMKVKEVMRELGVEAEVNHTDLGSVTPDMADVFICTRDLADSIHAGDVISIPNITDKNAMKEQLVAYMNR